MRKVLSLIICSLLICGTSEAMTRETLGGKFDSEKWVDSHFGKGKTPPFSFKYGGVPSDSFIRKWKWNSSFTHYEGDGTCHRTVTYTDPSTGLEISCFLTYYKDFPVAEWYMRLTNPGSARTPVISEFKVVDIAIRGKKSDTLKVQHCYGATSSLTDFTPRKCILASPSDTLSLVPNRGCSSDGVLPYFNVSSFEKGKDGFEGLIGGIGWTGTWKALFAKDGDFFSLKCGQALFEAFLEEGESVRTPGICLMFWNGDNEYSGNNLFRKFVLSHKTRKTGGKATRYPITAGFNWGAYPAPCNEYTCLTSEWAIGVMRQHQLFGIIPEVYWLDAGWYTTSTHKSWYDGVGDWKPDEVRFPGGLKDLSDEIHRNGKKFLVWFEVERAMPGTRWRTEHPEWMLHFNGKRYLSPLEDDDTMPALLDLSNPETVEWMTKEVGDIMEANGIDYYRQDFSMPPSAIWPLYDEPGRKGITEAKYIEGLYRYIDGLFDRFPSMIMDNCAAGGRRLDMEMTSRSAPLWRSDLLDNESQQGQTYGLSLFLPQHGTGYTGTDPYSYRSAASSAVHLWPQITNGNVNIDSFKKITWEFYLLRDYFLEDYYPLCGFEQDFTSRKIWLAYQLLCKDKGSGFIVGFRRPECPAGSFTVKLFGLDARKSYEITDIDTKDSWSESGEKLMEEGITLTSDIPRSSVLLHYQEIEK